MAKVELNKVAPTAPPPRTGSPGGGDGVFRQRRSQRHLPGPAVSALAAVILFGGGSLPAAQEPAPQTMPEARTPADLFKAFVASPPVIEELIWAREWPGALTNYHLTRYQSNAVFHGTGQRPLAADSPYTDYFLAAGRFDNTFWTKGFSDFMVWTNRHIAAERSNVVEYGYGLAVDSMASVLSMGCALADPGTVRWTGDSFAVTNRRRGVWLSGTLGRDEQERAAKLTVEVRQLNQSRSRPPTRVLTCDYVYARPLSLAYLPSEIWYTTSNSGAASVSLRILEIKTGQLPLAEDQFAFLAAQVPSPEQLYVVSNEFLMGWHGGRPTVSPDPLKADLRANLAGARVRRLYFGLALAALALGPLAFWLGRKWVSRGTPAKPGVE